MSTADLLYARRAEPPRSPAEERRIRYAYQLPSPGSTESAPALPEEVWVVEYDGFVSATWMAVPGSNADREDRDPPVVGALNVVIDRAEHAANAERISVGGRPGPLCRVPGCAGLRRRRCRCPPNWCSGPSSDSAATGAFTTTRRPGHDQPQSLSVRVYQYKRLVANVAVEWGTDGGDQRCPSSRSRSLMRVNAMAPVHAGASTTSPTKCVSVS